MVVIPYRVRGAFDVTTGRTLVNIDNDMKVVQLWVSRGGGWYVRAFCVSVWDDPDNIVDFAIHLARRANAVEIHEDAALLQEANAPDRSPLFFSTEYDTWRNAASWISTTWGHTDHAY